MPTQSACKTLDPCDQAMSVEIRPLSDLVAPGYDRLLTSSKEEGFRFVERLRSEFESGANRFDRPGEGLWGAFAGDVLIGIAGLNMSAESSEEGRVRRVYVLPEWRRWGVGNRLMNKVIAYARPWAKRLVLLTDHEDAARFYEGLGFEAVAGVQGVTHRLEFL